MATLQELQQALDQILNVVMQRGDELSPQVKSELALMLNDLAGQMQAERASVEPPPLPEVAEPPPLPAPPLDAEEDIGVRILWNIAGGDQEAFVNYLRTFPDPSLQALIRNPAQLVSTIGDLQRRYPQAEAGTTPDGLEEPQLQSSNIEAFKYDPRVRRLLVRFHGGGMYQYANVPPVIASLFMKGSGTAKTNGQNSYGKWWRGKNPSYGAALYQLIKLGGYPYKRIA